MLNSASGGHLKKIKKFERICDACFVEYNTDHIKYLELAIIFAFIIRVFLIFSYLIADLIKLFYNRSYLFSTFIQARINKRN